MPRSLTVALWGACLPLWKLDLGLTSAFVCVYVHVAPGYDVLPPAVPGFTTTAEARRLGNDPLPHLGPLLGDGSARLFAPPVFLDPSAPHPSHYMLWFQVRASVCMPLAAPLAGLTPRGMRRAMIV